MPELNSEKRRGLMILAKRARTKSYQRSPEKWYVERFGGKPTDIKWSLHPEYANHQWDGTPDPFFTAMNALKSGKNVGIEAATGVGKTYLAARFAYWFLDCFPESAVITSAPTMSQLLEVLWKEISLAYPTFRKLHAGSEILTGEIRVNKNKKYDDTNGKDYSNRMISRVGRKRAGEDSSVAFQGIHHKHQLFILDEAAGLDNSVLTAIKNTNTDLSEGSLNLILALGNPDSVTDALHVFCLGQNVEHVRISAYDHPNIVLKKAIIPGAVSEKSISIRKAEYGEESNLYRSRVRGIAPEQSTDSLIMLKWIMQCSRYHQDFQRDKIKQDHLSRSAVGVDVANSLNGDAACLAWGIDNRLVELHEFQCPNATDLADNLLLDQNELLAQGIGYYGTKHLNDYGITPDYVGVDGVGLGVATVNQFTRRGMRVQSLGGGCDETAIPLDKEKKPLYRFANLRAQMYFQARIDLMNFDLSIDIIQRHILFQLAKELTMVRYKLKDAHILIEKKDDIKERLGNKSPNMADAFVYWNWVRKKRSGMYVTEMPIAYGYTETEDTYDEHFDEPNPGDALGLWRPHSSELD